MNNLSQKLAVFDFDSTLMNGESINIILNQVLTDRAQKRELEIIRAKGMSGEIDLKSSLIQRLAFFRGLKIEAIEAYCQEFSWITGAHSTIAALKRNGYITICISASFRTAVRHAITELGIDAYAANSLEIKNEVLTGKLRGDLMHHQSKGTLLNKIQNELGISPNNTVTVGDGANDLSMFAYADTRIAFCAQDLLKEKATHIINTKNLSEVLNCI